MHAHDNQPTNQRRHDTAYLNKRLFYQSKVRRLKICNTRRNLYTSPVLNAHVEKIRIIALPYAEKLSK